MEQAITFQVDGKNLMGVWHTPGREGSPAQGSSFPAVLFLHGFTGTKVEPHRIFVKMARELAKSGIASLRFDFRGSGDSEGELQEMTILTEVADAHAALNFAFSQKGVNGRMGVIALSLGAVVAASLSKHPRIDSLVLWAPSLYPYKKFLAMATQKDHTSLKQRGIIDHYANIIGKPFIEHLATVNPLQDLEQYNGPVLILHGTNDEDVPLAEGKEYATFLSRRGNEVSFVPVDGSSHTFDSYEWESKVVAITKEWLRHTLMADHSVSGQAGPPIVPRSQRTD